MTATLPTPVITTPRSPYADEQGRSRTVTYMIREATTEVEGYAVELAVSHSKGRKRFVASLQPVTLGKKGEGPFTSTSFMLFSGVTVGAEPVARFSAKAIESFTERMIAKVAALAETNPQVAALFTDETSPNRMFGKES